MKQILRATLSIVLIGFWGCSKDVNREELPGDYYIDFPHGVMTLHLREDGTFTQTFVSNINHDSCTTSGTWRYDPQKQNLGLKPFINVLDMRGKPLSTPEVNTDGFSLYDVRRFGRVFINYMFDTPYTFERVQ